MATLLSSMLENDFSSIFPTAQNCVTDLEFAEALERHFINVETSALRQFSKTFDDEIKGAGLNGKIKRAFNFSVTEVESFLKTVRDAKYLRVYNGFDNFGNHVSFCSLIKADNTVVISNGTFLLSDLPCPPRPHCPNDPILEE